MALIDSLIEDRWLRSDRIIKAFRKIKRVDFLPDHLKSSAELNTALPIGLGQTISQPLVVAFMLEQLQPQPGDKVLDVGSGSGWTATLLAEIVGPKGKVFAIDIIPEIMEFGKNNVRKYNFIKKRRIQFICADGSKGFLKEAPFDRILASASAASIPSAWRKQLKVGGRIVAPIGSSIFVLEKKSKKEFQENEFPGFLFVPLVSEKNEQHDFFS